MCPILNQINSPADLKKLSIRELQDLAAEIREFLVENVARTGGHLAPNLGAVELTIALHRVFDAPRDKIVWDVGHQAYVHKILTGRRDRFHTLRQFGGISGFPKISESEYDAFGAVHSSTSISAAFGLAVGRDLAGEHYKVAAVIGDGAMTGGMAFEGLNNAGCSKRDFIVILNDNAMSISPNVGAVAKYLTHIISAPMYNRIKRRIWDWTGTFPRGSGTLRRIIQRLEEVLKSMLVPGLLFERLGFRYFGPVDGHDLDWLVRLFGEIRKLSGPIFVHLVTTKGKGYRYAEEDATAFHGTGAFCPETGKAEPANLPSYTDVFGQTLVELAEKNDKIMAVTAAMADGTGLVHFQKRFPDRFFDVGIAEQHAVTFSAGLALQGFRPVVAIYSTFLQRAYDQIIHDVALQSLPLVFVLDRGGLVGEDGPTHHGSFDLSYLRLIPNMVIMAPRDENELRDMLWTALQYNKGPIAIRYPRGRSLGLIPQKGFHEIPIGRSELLRDGEDAALLCVGDQVWPCMEAAESLESSHGIKASVVDMRFVKPLDTGRLRSIVQKSAMVVTVENNTMLGGFGGAVAEWISEQGIPVPFRRFGLPDRYVPHGRPCDLMHELKLDKPSLVREIAAFYRNAREGGRTVSKKASRR